MMAAVGLIAGVCYSFGGAAIDVLVTAGVINSASTPGVSWGTARGLPGPHRNAGLLCGLRIRRRGHRGTPVCDWLVRRIRLWGGTGEGTWVTWAVSVVGFSLAGAVVGATYGVVTGGVEASFMSAFYGALIGGGVLGGIAALLSHHLRWPSLS